MKLTEIMEQGKAHSLPIYSIQYLKFQLEQLRQQKEIKGIQIYKEEIKVLLFADDMIVYISDPKNSTRELLNLINSFGNGAGYKINSNKSVALIYTKDNQAEKKNWRNNTLHNSHK